jgi:hypothetical protein
MSISVPGGIPYPFKWFFRPETPPVVIVSLPGEDLPIEQISSLLTEIDERHWGAIRQVLIETKLKAEAMLRSDVVVQNAQLLTYYTGWVNYADFVLANFEGLRSGQMIQQQEELEPPR